MNWKYIAPGAHHIHLCRVPDETLCGQGSTEPNDYYSVSWLTAPVVCEECLLWKLVEEMTQ